MKTLSWVISILCCFVCFTSVIIAFGSPPPNDGCALHVKEDPATGLPIGECFGDCVSTPPCDKISVTVGLITETGCVCGSRLVHNKCVGYLDNNNGVYSITCIKEDCATYCESLSSVPSSWRQACKCH